MLMCHLLVCHWGNCQLLYLQQQQWIFPTCNETFNWHSFLNHTAEITEEPIVMLSGNNIQGRKNILYGDLFANYSILRVDTV